MTEVIEKLSAMRNHNAAIFGNIIEPILQQALMWHTGLHKLHPKPWHELCLKMAFGRSETLGRILKYLLYLVVLLVVVVAAYALVFDLPAPENDVVVPVEINLSQ